MSALSEEEKTHIAEIVGLLQYNIMTERAVYPVERAVLALWDENVSLRARIRELERFERDAIHFGALLTEKDREINRLRAELPSVDLSPRGEGAER